VRQTLHAIKQGLQCIQIAYNYFVTGEDEESQIFFSWQDTEHIQAHQKSAKYVHRTSVQGRVGRKGLKSAWSPLNPKVEKCSDWAENLTTDPSRYSKIFFFYSFIFYLAC
jgi:hypothetical protein